MIAQSLSAWLRAKADELEQQKFPDILGGMDVKTCVASLSLAEPEFDISMNLNYKTRRSKYDNDGKPMSVRFAVMDSSGATLALAYKAYLESKASAAMPPVDPIAAAEQALGTTTPTPEGEL